MTRKSIDEHLDIAGFDSSGEPLVSAQGVSEVLNDLHQENQRLREQINELQKRINKAWAYLDSDDDDSAYNAVETLEGR